MKKILLSCFLALGIIANAQFYVNESFESGTSATFAISGGSSPSVYNLTPSSCDGLRAIGSNLWGTGTTATTNLVYTSPAGVVGNGKKIDVSFTVSTIPYAAGDQTGGTVTVGYSTDNGTTYTNVGTPLTLASGTTGETCTAYSVTIPETANITGGVKIRIQAQSTASVNDFYIFFDKINITQEVSAAPVCTTATYPANNATGIPARPTFTWAPAENAQGYRVLVGTTAGASDVVNDTTSNLSYIPTTGLPGNQQLYVTIVPYNTLGDATGCVSTAFTTEVNDIAPYCGPIISTIPAQMFPIRSVEFAGVTNESNAGATTFGTYVPHENFMSTVFEVANNLTTLPITVRGVGSGSNGFAMSVFVDWNEDGDFNDAGESYFNTTATIRRSATPVASIITLTGNMAIPTGVALGTKRMRVKYNFSGTTIHTALTTACTDVGNGQVEEYLINYKSNLAATDVVNTKVSVYPNPFSDVLNISDVKGVKSVVFTDVAGRQIKAVKSTSAVNTSDLKAGLYIVTLHMEDGTVKSFKTIKK